MCFRDRTPHGTHAAGVYCAARHIHYPDRAKRYAPRCVSLSSTGHFLCLPFIGYCFAEVVQSEEVRSFDFLPMIMERPRGLNSSHLVIDKSA